MEETPKTNHHITLWVILIVLLLAAGGFAAYVYFSKSSQISADQAEKVAWMRIKQFEDEMQLDSLEAAISYYQWNFANGSHADAVRMLKDKIESEKRDWSHARYSDSVETIEDFIRDHSDSFFRVQADRMVDSLSFVEAADIDTYESYRHYLDSFSNGLFAQQAKDRIKDLEGGTVTSNETGDIAATINQHFIALANNNSEQLMHTVADRLTTYLGKTEITRADVLKYMEQMHAIEGRHIEFFLRNLIVTKEVNDHTPTFIATFIANEEVTTDGKTGQMIFAGRATLDSQGKITGLILSQQQ